MDSSKLAIERATRKDVEGILDLQERNLPENGGMLSVRQSHTWFETAIDDMPVIVARDGEHVVGYVVSTSIVAQSHIPIVQEMLQAYPGSPGAYIYGPICVADSHRQRGLAMTMFEELRRQLPNREGFTFIQSDNAVSKNVHTRMGMQVVAEFVLGDIAYVVLAYSG